MFFKHADDLSYGDSMRIKLAMFILFLTFLVLSHTASAGIPEVRANNLFNVEPEEEFEIVIFVDAHADEANYTVIVTLHQRFEFASDPGDVNVSGNEGTITYVGYDTDSIRFEFPLFAKNGTPEGDYNIPYEVKWNGSETSFVLTDVEEGTVRVSVGEGGGDTNCSSAIFLIIPAFSIGIIYAVNKRKRRCLHAA
jgi:hypothetical protein